MEFLYEVGPCKHFKQDGNLITVYSLAVKLNRDIIGSYVDIHGIVKRIRQDSVRGKAILSLLLNTPLLERSENEKRLMSLITNVGKKF